MTSFWTDIAYVHVLTSHITVFTYICLIHSDWISLSTRSIMITEILDNIYIWVFLVNSECVKCLSFLKYMLYSHCTHCTHCTHKSFFFLYFLEAKRSCFVTKNHSEFFIYLRIYFVQKTVKFILEKPQEWLFAESCPTPHWIAILYIHIYIYNIYI